MSVCVSGWCVCVCFFFQAEDGIRDRDVTGVQTVLFRSAVLYSRGPVCTGGRQVTEPGLGQSQLPRICLRPRSESVV